VQSGVESFESGYPFLQYFVDFKSDIDSIYRFMIQNKISFLVNRFQSDREIEISEMSMNSVAETVFMVIKEIISSTKREGYENNILFHI